MKKKLALVSRVLAGLLFFVSGINEFLHLFPITYGTDEARQMTQVLHDTNYFYIVLRGLQIVIGLMFLANRFVPLALLILAPMAVHIALFNFIVNSDVGATIISLVIVALESLLVWAYWGSFRSVLAVKAQVDP